MKKLMKRIGAVLMAVAMMAALGVTSSFAATTEDISVSGLQNGDKVKFIQVIQWDDVNGWTYVDGLTAPEGKELPNIKTITGKLEGTPATLTEGSISAAHAAILAQAAAGLNGVEKNAESGTAKYENAPVGLYYAQVIPGTADYLYNTIFVGADFESNGSNTIAADTATLAADTENGKAAIAKREQVTLSKDANGETDNIKYDHAIGDTIPFTITSKVPAYGDGYVNPQYSITDTMDTGLEYQGDATVTIEGVTDLTANQDYIITPDGKAGFTVELTKTGLGKVAKLGEAKTITINYNAKITSLDDATVTQKKNNATVTFSNKPTDSNSVSKLEDKTRHYTFSIDAKLFGDESYETSELVKIGIDENGNEITKKDTYSNGEKHGALGGAKFGLYKTKAAADAATADDVAGTPADCIAIQTSDADDGKLTFTGLDAGDYYLVELKAPDGWIKDPTVKKITISATYEEIPAGSYEDANGIKVNYDAYKVLKNYTVAVEGGNSSTYTITNTKSNEETANNHDVTADGVTKTEGKAGDNSTKLGNTKGTELPSTGGIGTYIFTITGVAIMAIAAGLLIVRHKKKAE